MEHICPIILACTFLLYSIPLFNLSISHLFKRASCTHQHHAIFSSIPAPAIRGTTLNHLILRQSKPTQTSPAQLHSRAAAGQPRRPFRHEHPSRLRQLLRHLQSELQPSSGPIRRFRTRDIRQRIRLLSKSTAKLTRSRRYSKCRRLDSRTLFPAAHQSQTQRLPMPLQHSAENRAPTTPLVPNLLLHRPPQQRLPRS